MKVPPMAPFYSTIFPVESPGAGFHVVVGAARLHARFEAESLAG